ncbi:hypothetical protein FOTG_07866 [Fusarium oxysporum f. sp. vasinfectum 25433]|uniref:Uncharacterized protein n=1 Tax=Fusarium oxysporum f. sp. vasinfectum 25433 TaxID=1089449 RepID=X0LWJ6_FUSOX|nr:hypothetical protein FOTG_07866 [Fusarium oxysporum f. sp. vasinfectum 25433]KAI8409741.1 hypothetical protein FOFC_09583 [Fusarium oxysporum]
MMWMAESYYGSTRNIDAKEGIKFLPTSRNMFFRGCHTGIREHGET